MKTPINRFTHHESLDTAHEALIALRDGRLPDIGGLELDQAIDGIERLLRTSDRQALRRDALAKVDPAFRENLRQAIRQAGEGLCSTY